MSAPVALVTGANTGIGFEIARGLLQAGHHVVLGCRDVKKGEAAKAQLLADVPGAQAEVMQVDLANLARLRNVVPKFQAKVPRLSLLVHNAGCWPRTRRRTEDGFELTLGVNHLGPFFLTHALLPQLEAGARVVVLTSSLHLKATFDFDDPMFKVRKHHAGTAYGQSKLANVLFTLALARRLKDRGVTVNAVHPGVVATELTREAPDHVREAKGKLTPRDGARAPLHLCLSDTLAQTTGAYFEGTVIKPPAPVALQEAVQERLWSWSLTQLKLAPA